MKLYIAGPMRGYPQFNFPAFFTAESQLTSLGHEVFNPARADNDKFGVDVGALSPEGDEAKLGAQTGFTVRDALNRDMEWITKHADGIYMLKGWEKSAGAFAEWAMARGIGIEIFYEASPPSNRAAPTDQSGPPSLVLNSLWPFGLPPGVRSPPPAYPSMN